MIAESQCCSHVQSVCYLSFSNPSRYIPCREPAAVVVATGKKTFRHMAIPRKSAWHKLINCLLMPSGIYGVYTASMPPVTHIAAISCVEVVLTTADTFMPDREHKAARLHVLFTCVFTYLFMYLLVHRDGAAQLQSELQSLEQQESSMRKQLEHKEKRLQAVEGQIQELQQSIQEHKAELSSDLHNHLSAVERQELADLTPRLKQLQVWCAAVQKNHHNSYFQVVVVKTVTAVEL